MFHELRVNIQVIPMRFRGALILAGKSFFVLIPSTEALGVLR